MKNKVREREREAYCCRGEVNFPATTPKLHVLERFFSGEKWIREIERDNPKIRYIYIYIYILGGILSNVTLLNIF